MAKSIYHMYHSPKHIKIESVNVIFCFKFPNAMKNIFINDTFESVKRGKLDRLHQF